MTDTLLEYLNSQTRDEYILINDILKSSDQYKSKSSEQLHQYLSRLVVDGIIEVKDKANSRLGLHTQLKQNDPENTMTNLDNWPMHARITEFGKDKMQLSSKAWYDTENARRQFEDYPKTKERTIWAFRLSILALVLTVILGLLKLKCQ